MPILKKTKEEIKQEREHEIELSVLNERKLKEQHKRDIELKKIEVQSPQRAEIARYIITLFKAFIFLPVYIILSITVAIQIFRGKELPKFLEDFIGSV